MELKPCPFCGEPAEFDAGNSIHCTYCHASMVWDEDLDQEYMIEEWNTRHGSY